MSSTAAPVVTLIEKLKSLTPRLEEGENQVTRNDALELARELVRSLERPEDVAGDTIFSPLVPVAAKIAIDLDLLGLMVKCDGAITSDELAEQSGAEELLITRILRVLAAAGLIADVGDRTWQASPITRAMAVENIAAGYRMVQNGLMAAANMAPKYLKEIDYRCPTDPKDGLMQYTYQSKLNSFQILYSLPGVLEDFSSYMGHVAGARQIWLDWFPIQERLIDGASEAKDSVLLVDIAGNQGHDLIAFQKKYPNHGRRLILQDLPMVIKDVGTLPPGIEAMAYDFFTEQPVKGARAYYYHHTLHNWSDYKCEEMLNRVRAAMKPGYSKLFIHDMIVPETKASSFIAMMDLMMMIFNGGIERTARQWKTLLERAGLEVVRVWLAPEADAGGIVEAVVKG
ncbi:sterigmatocystin 8-O-methyltransferase [Xylariaceae sp. FL1651]|nr:sterigmatocystin 8-O-methyltransferase [Xylariaceae sp. FL1651]